MRCPECKRPLQYRKAQYVEFYVCLDCRGIWVAGNQFRALVVKMAADTQVQPEVQILFRPRQVAQCEVSQTGAHVHHCPDCYTPMREFNYAYDSNIFLDRCEQCQGIWMDTGEVMQIARHIQYNPDIVAAGRGILGLKKNPLAECEKNVQLLLQVVTIILRFLIFRM